MRAEARPWLVGTQHVDSKMFSRMTSHSVKAFESPLMISPPSVIPQVMHVQLTGPYPTVQARLNVEGGGVFG